MTDQLALDLSPLVVPDHEPEASIQERFELFHRLNPWVYAALERLTLKWLDAGHERAGIGMLTEVLRWEYSLATRGDDFKLNNNFRSRYVRLLIEAHPAWDDAFETRTLRAA